MSELVGDCKQKPKISYSKMMTFLTCPQKYYRQYVLKEPRPEFPALKFGSAVHKWLENYLAGTPVELVSDDLPYLRNKDAEQVANEFNLAQTLCLNALDTLQNLEVFGISNFDNIKFVVEEHFEIDIGVAIFNGYIDLSFKNDKGEIIIIDWKTTSAEYNKHQIKSSPQLTGYAYAYYKLYGVLPDKVCYVTLNKKTEQIKVYCDSRTIEDILEIEVQLKHTALMIQQNMIYRFPDSCYTYPSGWRCDFFNDCWGEREAIIANTEERGIVTFKRPTIK